MDEFRKSLLLETPALMRYATALMGDYPNAEELVAQCIERALKIAEHRDTNLKLRYWLLAILTSIYNNLENNLNNNLNNNPDNSAYAGLGDDIEPRAKPESKFDKLFLQEIQTALHSLPTQQKQVLLLVTLEDIPYKDIKTIMDLPLSKVMALLHQSRQTLRQQTFPAANKIEVAS